MNAVRFTKPAACVVSDSWVAAPAVTVKASLVETDELAVNAYVMLFEPIRPVYFRSTKVTTPLTALTAVVPVRPDAIDAVTDWLSVVQMLPSASFKAKTGWFAKATPLVTVAELAM